MVFSWAYTAFSWDPFTAFLIRQLQPLYTSQDLLPSFCTLGPVQAKQILATKNNLFILCFNPHKLFPTFKCQPSDGIPKAAEKHCSHLSTGVSMAESWRYCRTSHHAIQPAALRCFSLKNLLNCLHKPDFSMDFSWQTHYNQHLTEFLIPLNCFGANWHWQDP